MKPRKLFVQLGRLGDVLNVLPLLKREYDLTGEKPILQVAAEFADVMDGVGYADKLVWYGPWDYPFPAMKEARNFTTDITLCQIHGAGLCNPHRTTSFAREAWLSANADVPWGSLPLVFDRRDKEREMALVMQTLGHCGFYPNPDRKLVLFSGMGKSSPFPHNKALLRAMGEWLGPKYQVLDLGQIKAHRFYDLLGLYERAHCLVSIDTAHQHLAPACPELPVIALCTRDPGPWHGSPWRKEHVARFFYDEFPEKMWDVVDAISKAREPRPQIIHVWADWRTKPDPEATRRHANAAASWQVEYATGLWVPREMKHSDSTRDGLGIGDPHNVNYVHDTVEFAVRAATSSKDIIALTNADIGFTPGLTGMIIEQVTRRGAVFTHRRDHPRIEAPFINEARIGQGEWYPGTDAFFFTVEWWQLHKAEYGDFLMGREYWDETFRQLVKYHGGGYIPNAVWHEWHESSWCGEGRWTMPGNVHNYRLRDVWFTETGFIPEDFRYFRTVETGPIHPKPYPDEPLRGP